MSLGFSWCSESRGLILGRLLPFCFRPANPPVQCRARFRVTRRYLRRRTVAFSSLFKFVLPTPSSAQSRGATRVACSRVTWYRAKCTGLCVIFFLCVLYLFYFFSSKHFPPSRGCRSRHLLFRVFVASLSNPPPCRWPAGGFWYDFSLVLAPVFPSISTRAHLAIVPFLWLVCRRAFSALPPATPAVCGRLLMGGLPGCRVCVPSTAFLRVFLAP